MNQPRAKDMHGVEIGAGDIVIADTFKGVVMSFRPCATEGVTWQWVTVRIGDSDVEFSSFMLQVSSKAFDFVEQIRLASRCDRDASAQAVLDHVCNQLQELQEWRTANHREVLVKMVKLSLERNHGRPRVTAEELGLSYRLVCKIAADHGFIRRKIKKAKCNV